MIKHTFLIALIFLSANLFAENASVVNSTESKKTTLTKEQMFNVLAAEFALNRNLYEDALHFYLINAESLKEPYFAERSTKLAMHLKKFNEMLTTALIWQKSDPKNPIAHYFTALAYGFSMQPNIAVENMRKVLSLKGDTDFTQLVNLLPNDSEAETFFTHELIQASQLYPENYDVDLALALLYQRSNQKELALLRTDNAVKKSKNNLTVIDYAVRIYTNYDKPEKALNAYQLAIKNNPENYELRHALAQFALRYDLEESKNQFLHLLKVFPKDDYCIFNLGLIYFEQDDTVNAEKMFNSLLELKKRISAANFYLGGIYKNKGDNAKALAYFSKITDKVESQNALEQIVSIYIEEGKLNEALALTENGLQKSKKQDHTERLQILKAMTLQKQGKLQDAYQLLTHLLDKNPDSFELRYSRAMVAETKNELPEMESDLRQIINNHPDSALALNALGYTLADKTDRYREALELIQQAQKILPDDPSILDSLGWVLYRLGRINESLTYLKKAFVILPDADVAAHLGEVLWMSGAKEDAKRVFSDAINRSPDHVSLTETMKRLNVTP